MGFDVISMPRQVGCDFEEIPFSWGVPSAKVMIHGKMGMDNVNTSSPGEKMMTGNPVLDSFDCATPCAMSVGDCGNNDLSVFTSAVKDLSLAPHLAPQEVAHAPSSSSSRSSTSSSNAFKPSSSMMDSVVSNVQSNDLTRRNNSTTGTSRQDTLKPLELPLFLVPTNFSTERPLAEVTASIFGSFSDAEKFQFEIIPFECSFTIQDEEVCFRINVYADTTTDKSVPRYVVEVQRLSGCAFAFASVYESFKSSIVDTKHHLSVLTPRATNLADVVNATVAGTEADAVNSGNAIPHVGAVRSA